MIGGGAIKESGDDVIDRDLGRSVGKVFMLLMIDQDADEFLLGKLAVFGGVGEV